MESLIIITLLCKVVAIFTSIYLLYELLKYIGFDKSTFVLSILLHFLGGYLMFFS
jgi:hypothetical protein